VPVAAASVIRGQQTGRMGTGRVGFRQQIAKQRFYKIAENPVKMTFHSLSARM
jgi:hypothetical protein